MSFHNIETIGGTNIMMWLALCIRYDVISNVQSQDMVGAIITFLLHALTFVTYDGRHSGAKQDTLKYLYYDGKHLPNETIIIDATLCRLQYSKLSTNDKYMIYYLLNAAMTSIINKKLQNNNINWEWTENEYNILFYLLFIDINIFATKQSLSRASRNYESLYLPHVSVELLNKDLGLKVPYNALQINYYCHSLFNAIGYPQSNKTLFVRQNAISEYRIFNKRHESRLQQAQNYKHKLMNNLREARNNNDENKAKIIKNKLQPFEMLNLFFKLNHCLVMM